MVTLPKTSPENIEATHIYRNKLLTDRLQEERAIWFVAVLFFSFPGKHRMVMHNKHDWLKQRRMKWYF